MSLILNNNISYDDMKILNDIANQKSLFEKDNNKIETIMLDQGTEKSYSLCSC